VASVKNFKAMDYTEIGDFMTKLRAKQINADGTPNVINYALEFCILTCARTDTVLGAVWGECDTDKRVWTIPAERMKAKRDHRVALSSRAIDILQAMDAIKESEFVFPGKSKGAGLSEMVLLVRLQKEFHRTETVHGFRTTFRVWCAEETEFKEEVAELALAHKVGDAVYQAYQRSDLLVKRFALAEAWSQFCDMTPINDGSNVVPMRGAK